MISKRIYLQLIFRTLLLCAFVILSTYFFFEKKYILGGVISVLSLIQFCNLIHYLNATNRKIAYFIKAMINEDFTLNFNSLRGEKSLIELNESLNQLNKKIQQVYLKNQTQEKYYRELLKQAEIGVLTINDKGHILFANPKAESLLNYTPLNHIKQLNRVSPQFFQLLSKLDTFDKELLSLSNERETKQLALKSTKIILNKEQIRLVTLQDIRSELDNKETDSWLKLIRVLTHEIMNSISPITSISDSLLKLKDTTEESPFCTGLKVIKNQSDDLIRFVQSYRSFLSIPKPDRKIIDVKTFLERIQLVFSEDIKSKNIEFTLQIENTINTIFIDEQQFSQVLINLLRNAIQAVALIEDKKIILKATRENQKTLISVTNNGKQIPKEELSQIFIPFFTTKENGTGIGLSLSKHIIQMHEGSLEVFSFEEETLFLIRI